MIATAMLMQQAKMPKMNLSPSGNSDTSEQSKNAFEQLLNESKLLSKQSKTSHPNEHSLSENREQKEPSKAEMLLEKLQTAYNQMAQNEEDTAALDFDKIKDFVAVLKEKFLSSENNGEDIELSAKPLELDQLAALLTKNNPSVQVSQVMEPGESLKPLTANINNVNEYSGMVENEVQLSASHAEKDMLANLTEIVKWLEQATASIDTSSEWIQLMASTNPDEQQLYKTSLNAFSGKDMLTNIAKWLEHASVSINSSDMQTNNVEKNRAVPQLSEQTAELTQRMAAATSNIESMPLSFLKSEWGDRKPNTKLTSANIAAFLEQELGTRAKPEIGTVMQIQNDQPAGTWMPKLEQYVIHLTHAQGNTSPDQQLMEQFQKVIQSSKFLNAPSGGANQLSITLHPSNLGEMNLRFAEVNGEMTVKIMVTTQVAKDMLETNMKQLMNMFSPHQVVVEKQEMAVSQSENIDDAQQQQEEQDEKEERHFQQPDEQNSEKSELDFENHLNEILLNEKV